VSLSSRSSAWHVSTESLSSDHVALMVAHVGVVCDLISAVDTGNRIRERSTKAKSNGASAEHLTWHLRPVAITSETLSLSHAHVELEGVRDVLWLIGARSLQDAAVLIPSHDLDEPAES